MDLPACRWGTPSSTGGNDPNGVAREALLVWRKWYELKMFSRLANLGSFRNGMVRRDTV